MVSDIDKSTIDFIESEVSKLLKNLPNLKQQKWIGRSLSTIVNMAGEELERLDWKILAASLQDMEKGFKTFYPYRHVRKITIFGSARISPDTPEYKMAVEFAHYITKQGFMVMTGAGPGIMQAGNEGAGRNKSFGLNVHLPFEQKSNPFIEGDSKLINFKYFFTRKLFFLKESDALVLFPGGFGTLDEAFESLTLTQTGKYGPAPLVLIDYPGGNYWHDWNDFIHQQLLRRGLINPEDCNFYTITDNLESAYEAIANFYKVYHSSRYVGEKFVIRLNSELSPKEVDFLNQEFRDILIAGKIEKSKILPEESDDETSHLPRLIMHFNQKKSGRLFQMLAQINQMGKNTTKTHPRHK
ncbi:LOG family protein [Okeania sp.]|uniref:LOG family protein n=1 Tax=Okeania sp. TaxID=3100323 RepID=UPI002B4B6353|nr:LOG family protein [Okeania sp.]MEB3342479.1 LOG family protein [Okeania sp.]